MRIILVFSVLVGFTFNGYSQKCEFLKNNYDEFKGEVIRQTWGKFIREFSGNNANLIIQQNVSPKSNRYSIILNYNLQYIEGISIKKDDELILKCEPDTLITLHSINYCLGTFHTLFNITTTQIKPIYSITKENVEFLAKHKILKVRLYTSDGYYNHEIKKRNQINIMKAFDCITQ